MENLDLFLNSSEAMKEEYFNFLGDREECEIAIHCNTKEKANYLLAMYYSMKKMWNINSPILNNNEIVTRWGKDKDLTCYRVNDTEDLFIVRGLASFYQKKNVEVVEFEDIFSSVTLSEVYIATTDTDKKKKKALFSKKKDNQAENNVIENTPVQQTQETNNIYKYDYNDTVEYPDKEQLAQPDPIIDPLDYLTVNDESSNESQNGNSINDTDIEKPDNDMNDNHSTSAKETVLSDKTSAETDTALPITKNEFKIPYNMPFSIEGLNGRVFLINEQYQRFEKTIIYKNHKPEGEFWSVCNNETELVYILNNLHKIVPMDKSKGDEI